jgi:hypothetical protein
MYREPFFKNYIQRVEVQVFFLYIYKKKDQ